MNETEAPSPSWWPDWLYSLRSPRDRWLGEDKFGHLFGAAYVWQLSHSVVFTIGCILFIEFVQVIRWTGLTLYDRMAILSGKKPWPFMCDRVSLKDILVGVKGMLFAMAVVRWLS